MGQHERSNIFMHNLVADGKYLDSFELFLLLIMVFSMWIRSIFLLRYNEYMGNLTGIVQTMFY